MAENKRRAIIFMAWGAAYIQNVVDCIRESKLPDYDKILITDVENPFGDSNEFGLQVICIKFARAGFLHKTEFLRWLPVGYDSYLYLDNDTRVLGDIDLGFRKAEKHGIAMVPASQYCLEHSQSERGSFKDVMIKEGEALDGRMQYNTGVIFFSLSPEVKKVFELWVELAIQYEDSFIEDQPILSLACEQLGVVPYALSHSYNYRDVGDLISGMVRIWHSYQPVPADLNQYVRPWPPRRSLRGVVIRPEIDDKLVELIKSHGWNASQALDWLERSQRLAQDLEQAKEINQALTQALQAKDVELGLLYQSRSYRLTAPLRGLFGFFRRRFSQS